MRMRALLLLGVLALTLAFAGSAWAAFTPGSPGLGDPFFPLAGNGGYDVVALRAEPVVRAVDEPAHRHRDDRRDRDAGPVAVRPRPARLLDLAARRRRTSGDIHARRSGADRHAQDGHPLRLRVHRRRRLRRDADGRDRSRLLARGLGPDRRRRVRRRGAAGLAGVVPGRTTTHGTRPPTTSA